MDITEMKIRTEINIKFDLWDSIKILFRRNVTIISVATVDRYCELSKQTVSTTTVEPFIKNKPVMIQINENNLHDFIYAKQKPPDVINLTNIKTKI
jgi:hypothetical protein